MATETENYANKGLAKAAKARNSQRHIDGWRPIHTDFNPGRTRTGREKPIVSSSEYQS